MMECCVYVLWELLLRVNRRQTVADFRIDAVTSGFTESDFSHTSLANHGERSDAIRSVARVPFSSPHSPVRSRMPLTRTVINNLLRGSPRRLRIFRLYSLLLPPLCYGENDRGAAEVPSRTCAATPFTYTPLDNGERMLISGTRAKRMSESVESSVRCPAGISHPRRTADCCFN